MGFGYRKPERPRKGATMNVERRAAISLICRAVGLSLVLWGNSPAAAGERVFVVAGRVIDAVTREPVAVAAVEMSIDGGEY
jgi:hypothetical protein